MYREFLRATPSDETRHNHSCFVIFDSHQMAVTGALPFSSIVQPKSSATCPPTIDKRRMEHFSRPKTNPSPYHAFAPKSQHRLRPDILSDISKISTRLTLRRQSNESMSAEINSQFLESGRLKRQRSVRLPASICSRIIVFVSCI